MKRNILQFILSFILLVLFHLSAYNQVVNTIPVYPLEVDSCTVIFDAALGNAGLKDFTSDIYAHTGVITNLSTSSSDWKYVIAAWNVNTTKAKLTPLGNNKHKLVLKPSIRAFYGVPAAEQIEKLAFVFRNSDGTKTGRNADGSDIFSDVYPPVLSVNIALPAEKELFLKKNVLIPVSAISPMALTLKLFVNNSLIKTAGGQTITDTLTASPSAPFWVKQWVKVVAANNSGSIADSFSYTVIPDPDLAELPSGTVEGINYSGSSSAVLCLYAPGKNHAFVIGDFNDWKMDQDHYMKLSPDGKYFWLQVNGLIAKQEYIFQYVVDGNIRIGDPYCDKISDPNDSYILPSTYPGLKPYPLGKTTGIASFLQTDQTGYNWTSGSFQPPDISSLVVYELLIRDFTDAHTFNSVTDTLDYLKNLGVNAIELMPVMEFEGNLSWGYNTNYSFAVDKYYGPKNDLKHFVDMCHSKGIAVIFDIVCNHQFGSSPLAMLYWDGGNQRPAADNPWFNPVPKHPYNVGNDFNHESPATFKFMTRLLKYWLTDYHIDGYRFDLSKGFTQKNSYPDNVSLWGQYDASRISILKKYDSIIHTVNPSGFCILEHFADNSEEKVLSANNMQLWGNLNYAYIQAGGGWVSGSDLSWGSYLQRGWSQPNLVTYMESHDEERTMYKNISSGNNSKPPYLVKDTNTALKRIELNANFFLTIPGPKMLWQFGELGYDYSIAYGGDRLAPKPPRWDYLNQWRRRYTRNVFKVLAELKKTQPVFTTTSYNTDLTGIVKRMWLRHNTMDAVVLGNFDVVTKPVTPDFTKTGKWYEFYSGDSLDVQNVSATLDFKPGEYRLYTSAKLLKPAFTGIDDQDFNSFTNNESLLIYPNPSSGEFDILLKNSEFTKETIISVYDMQGRLLGQKRGLDLDRQSKLITIDLKEFLNSEPKDGLYLIRVSGNYREAAGKVIIRR